MNEPMGERGRQGAAPLRISDDETTFSWTCPTCGINYYGNLGPEPVGGWEAPVWKLTRDGQGVPSLQPSLGCRGLLDGTCTGHWFYRSGELVAA